MSEGTPSPSVETPVFTASSLARLGALSRAGFEPRTLVRSVTPFEIGALVLLVMLVAGVFVVYSFWILPDQVRYVQMSNEVAANRAKIEELQRQVVDPSLVTARFEEVRASLDEFRGGVLKPIGSGKLEIQNAISRTLHETGVRLASSVEYKVKDPLADAAQSGAKRSRKRDPSKAHEIRSYPSMRVEFSITGSYAQLRSFISRFEGGNQFVVIEAVTLNTDESGGKASGSRPGAGQPGLITLDIAMTAYFQPSGGTPASGAQ